MKFEFSRYQYQTDAANAVCDVFSGQPPQERVSYIRDVGQWQSPSLAPEPKQGDLGIDPAATEQGTLSDALYDELDDTGYRNGDLVLSSNQLLDNIHKVQRNNGLPDSKKLFVGNGAVELDVEMETGTGKTFVYTKTIFELNRRYGWSKFIIVVPSIAIREGVAKSLSLTDDYFYTSGADDGKGYGKHINWFVYNSSNLTELDRFAQSADISVMVINMQAFNTSMKENGRSKESRIIFSPRDDFGSRRPIDVIAAMRPIIIMDEPQKMGGKATQQGIGLFKPLFVLNYSATHKVKHDLVYSLDALDAYNQRLVKRIEVKGIELNNMRGTDGYLYLQDIIVRPNRAPQARIEFKQMRPTTGKVVKTTSTFDVNDDLYLASNELEAYRDDWRIAPDGIVPDQLSATGVGYVRFLNGTVLNRGEILNDGAEADMRRIQIRETIKSHLDKEAMLFERGIKCLSLFFIDEVAKYKWYDDNNEEQPGEYARMFEEEYDSCVHEYLNRFSLDADGERYRDWLRHTVAHRAHNGYFSIDKHGHSIDSTLKRGSDESDDISAYDLILKNKERLLSFDEPTRFIFSHSALREGWDNPNVFQICTLKHSDSETGKRQEVGRGLRLCVNKDGVRQDMNLLGDAKVQTVNLLTVIASESYATFTASLQKDIQSELRERPLKIDNAFFTHVTVPAGKLGPDHEGEEPVTFTAEEARKICHVLIKHDLIDMDDKLTDTYREQRLDESTTKDLEQVVPTSKIGAIRYSLDSVLEGVTAMLIGNALKKKILSNPLNENWQRKEFQALWKRINHKYAYTVDFKDEELIAKAVKAINDELVVSKMTYTLTRGLQKSEANRNELAAGDHFMRQHVSGNQELNVDASGGVTYDLLGEVARGATITRRCAAAILKGIRGDKFRMFKDNPEQFIAKVSKLIVQEKATMIVDHICYDRIAGEYDASIFTAGGNAREEAVAYRASKCVQDYVFPDGTAPESVERRFAKDLDAADEVAVYAKLPRGFQIPTPVGNYAPDWAVAFREGSGIKHLFFIAETKGSMDKFELRDIESGKIACAEKLFNDFQLAGDVRYEQAVTYQTLLDKIHALQ
ncbi:type III restriction endonuclease [Bifidobacterium ramosum]|uniref:Restriction endonuclease n=1 Tax=Bifidobacterium ramosum TaxID=1798158 RepID=A0A6L4WZC9_9BIFI|nr:DEAD/DEAH box helicase family protein [Bifidobacterium ramosum]KAB8287094.1 type III restriction endonuclease [Bifidobacterium ramosum]NEG71841.1 restriction endonuclease [Bifidobacterium ramosum]